MKVLTLNIPENVDVDNKQLAMIVADLAGLAKRTFAGLLGSYSVSIFNCLHQTFQEI